MWTLVWKIFALNCLFAWSAACAVCVGFLSTTCHGIADALEELSWMSLLSLAIGALAWGLCGVGFWTGAFATAGLFAAGFGAGRLVVAFGSDDENWRAPR